MPDCNLCHDEELREEWGCDRPSSSFSYDLGGEIVRRCPNALARLPIVAESWAVYGAYKKGITPGGQGLRGETALYRTVMATLERLEAEAEAWYLNKMETQRDGIGV